jgi:hypothetical protein
MLQLRHFRPQRSFPQQLQRYPVRLQGAILEGRQDPIEAGLQL